MQLPCECVTSCRHGDGEGMDVHCVPGFICSDTAMGVGVEDEGGGEICSNTFLSIISFMSSRYIPILNMSPSTNLHTCKEDTHMHIHTR